MLRGMKGLQNKFGAGGGMGGMPPGMQMPDMDPKELNKLMAKLPKK
jgi:hypothetical protein